MVAQVTNLSSHFRQSNNLRREWILRGETRASKQSPIVRNPRRCRLCVKEGEGNNDNRSTQFDAVEKGAPTSSATGESRVFAANSHSHPA